MDMCLKTGALQGDTSASNMFSKCITSRLMFGIQRPPRYWLLIPLVVLQLMFRWPRMQMTCQRQCFVATSTTCKQKWERSTALLMTALQLRAWRRTKLSKNTFHVFLVMARKSSTAEFYGISRFQENLGDQPNILVGGNITWTLTKRSCKFGKRRRGSVGRPSDACGQEAASLQKQCAWFSPAWWSQLCSQAWSFLSCLVLNFADSTVSYLRMAASSCEALLAHEKWQKTAASDSGRVRHSECVDISAPGPLFVGTSCATTGLVTEHGKETLATFWKQSHLASYTRTLLRTSLHQGCQGKSGDCDAVLWRKGQAASFLVGLMDS